MARNSEKQLGRLNRLWLQKEKDEGRITEIRPRPKLGSLLSAAAVKHWIPSIKNEMEYYLQQSQLPHYPERKIQEFHKRLEELQKEYGRFIHKLRVLEPSSRQHPWTPRGYTKKRGKKLGDNESSEPTDLEGLSSEGFLRTGSEVLPVSKQPEVFISQGQNLTNQDQPLSFDTTRMAMAVAGSRTVPADSGTTSLSQVLLSGLPNIHSSPLAQTLAAHISSNARQPLADTPSGPAQYRPRPTEAPPSRGPLQQNPADVLGLASYLSSSDEET